jgi:hypothetical protein
LRSAVIRLSVAAALLVVLPFSGIRVTCYELPAESGAAAITHELTECERLCPLHQIGIAASPAVDFQSGDTRNLCALTSDGAALDCVSYSAVAVVRAHEPPQAPVLAPSFYVASSRLHLDPAHTPAGPPPKSRAV